MMEVYVQELSSLAYMKHLDSDCLERIKAFALIFLNICEQVKSFRAAQVPVSVWYILFSRWKKPVEFGWKRREKIYMLKVIESTSLTSQTVQL